MLEQEKFIEKLDAFFRTSLQYFGKEICLPSNQFFEINYIQNPSLQQDGNKSYTIQYGFPQSGCVSLGFYYSTSSGDFHVDKITIYAPPRGETIMMANFSPCFQHDEISVHAQIGMDMGTVTHSNREEIMSNPNALKMLDIATSDLARAEVLGDCRVSVPSDSKTIPCSHSSSRPKGKEFVSKKL